MKEILLTQGKVALVDDEDYEVLIKHKWFSHKGYASTNITENGKRRTLRMHRFLLNEPKGLMVDHINHNTTDNRRCNIRVSTNQQNLFNQKLKKHSSKYKGVTWYETHKKWCVRIRFNKSIYLGLFEDEKEAGRVYNENAIKYFGEFALLNDID